jgi:hypothetical protein
VGSSIARRSGVFIGSVAGTGFRLFEEGFTTSGMATQSGSGCVYLSSGGTFTTAAISSVSTSITAVVVTIHRIGS